MTPPVGAIPRFGRTRTIGVLVGLLGLVLVGLVAGNVTPDDRTINFEQPPDPVSLTLDPGTAIAAIGVVYLLIGQPTPPRCIARAAFIASASLPPNCTSRARP